MSFHRALDTVRDYTMLAGGSAIFGMALYGTIAPLLFNPATDFGYNVAAATGAVLGMLVHWWCSKREIAAARTKALREEQEARCAPLP